MVLHYTYISIKSILMTGGGGARWYVEFHESFFKCVKRVEIRDEEVSILEYDN